MAALEIQRITRRFGSLMAVDNVSFAVDSGSIYGFIGPNGAGKTTTMRICATLDLPDSGDVLVSGRSVVEQPREVRACLGFMPDAYGAYANTSVQEYLDFFARAYGLRGRKRMETVAQVMDFTSLKHMPSKEMGSLSKGMRQRLCLAKTLLHDPSIMILDEPAAGLDPRARVELRELLRALAEMGKAVLISSHILTELSEMCDGVVVIEQGRVRATGSVEEITRSLKPHVQVFVRAMAPAEELERVLVEQPFVAAVRAERNGLVFDFSADEEGLARLLGELVQRGLRPIQFAPESIDLEDIFLTLTEGRAQ
jgi:ABC-2 type transport system ATP-binding protein